MHDQRTVGYFQQSIQSAYLCGSIIQLHYHPYEAEDGTEYDHEANVHDVQRLQARLTEIDNHLEAWHKAIPANLRPDWGQTSSEDGDNTTGFEPAGNSQFFHAGGEWWWRHAMGGMLEMNYLARKSRCGINAHTHTLFDLIFFLLLLLIILFIFVQSSYFFTNLNMWCQRRLHPFLDLRWLRLQTGLH